VDGTGTATVLERATVGVLATSFSVSGALVTATPGVETVAYAAIAYVGAMVALPVVLWRPDRRDGGGRLWHYFAVGLSKWSAGLIATTIAFNAA
jgi:hypothetical protein